MLDGAEEIVNSVPKPMPKYSSLFATVAAAIARASRLEKNCVLSDSKKTAFVVYKEKFVLKPMSNAPVL